MDDKEITIWLSCMLQPKKNDKHGMMRENLENTAKAKAGRRHQKQ